MDRDQYPDTNPQVRPGENADGLQKRTTRQTGRVVGLDQFAIQRFFTRSIAVSYTGLAFCSLANS